MTGARLVRTSGMLLVIGGLLLGAMNVATSVVFAGDTAAQTKAALWTPLFALVAVGTMLVLFGAPALYSRIAGAGGWMAQAGLVLVAVAGLGLGFFGNLDQALILPWVASNDPAMLGSASPTPAALTGFYLVTAIIELLGVVGLSVPLLRGRLQPRWAGGALVLAAVFGILSSVTNGGMSSNVGLSLLSALPTVLLASFFVEMGRRMLRDGAPMARSVLETSPQPAS